MALGEKNPPANAGKRCGSMPGLGRSPGRGNGSPLQYSCLENPMDRGVLTAIVQRGRKSHLAHRQPPNQWWLVSCLGQIKFSERDTGKRAGTRRIAILFKYISVPFLNVFWKHIYCFYRGFVCLFWLWKKMVHGNQRSQSFSDYQRSILLLGCKRELHWPSRKLKSS